MSEANNVWVHKGFDAFSQGRFDDGGSNLYVNAKGIIERIHRTDINNNGYVDIVLANSHGYVERAVQPRYSKSIKEKVKTGRNRYCLTIADG